MAVAVLFLGEDNARAMTSLLAVAQCGDGEVPCKEDAWEAASGPSRLCGQYYRAMGKRGAVRPANESIKNTFRELILNVLGSSRVRRDSRNAKKQFWNIQGIR